jgi:acetylornithine aminotransferase/acetylornithine/N-succinyldiaminopimelate aminotransferase
LTPATPEYLLGLRKLCDEKKLLLLMDAVQDGQFRTGRYQAFQRILERAVGVSPAEQNSDSRQDLADAFLPDGISIAKSLGNGFPIGAIWVRAPHADLFGPGTHGTTFGGSPLGCAVALKVFEVIQKENLAENARNVGEFLKNGLLEIARKYPGVIRDVRGLGLMLGFELAANIPNLPGDPGKTQAIRFVNLLHNAGLLTIPAGASVIRLLPALNLRKEEAVEGLKRIESVAAKLS